MAYTLLVIFIETAVFTEEVKALLSDDEYRSLQEFMAANPKYGRVLRDTGGLRKLRWAIEGRGKRGGVRVIYYYVTSDERIRMIYI